MTDKTRETVEEIGSVVLLIAGWTVATALSLALAELGIHIDHQLTS